MGWGTTGGDKGNIKSLTLNSNPSVWTGRHTREVCFLLSMTLKSGVPVDTSPTSSDPPEPLSRIPDAFRGAPRLSPRVRNREVRRGQRSEWRLRDDGNWWSRRRGTQRQIELQNLGSIKPQHSSHIVSTREVQWFSFVGDSRMP